jgi:eukaryotic-like serine/threonine-protein kinase
MADSLGELDLSGLFIAPRIAAELPDEVFVRRATRQLPGPVVVPAPPGFAAAEPELPQPGAVIGRFRLERAIGLGGFGAVFRARHVVLGTTVAIKLMRPSVVRARPELVRLLAEEAKLAARIDHPRVVRVLDVATGDAQPYVVMEFVDGPDLAVMLRRRGALPYKMVVRVLRHISEALSAGLARDLIHRDVKPSNILLTRAGLTKLADFGLARSRVGAAASPALGVRGVVGTAAYMAPEQASPAAAADFRSDIYALGVTGYQALTGALPAVSPEAVIPPGRVVAGIPAALDALILAMMAHAPADRPASYAALDEALRGVR